MKKPSDATRALYDPARIKLPQVVPDPRDQLRATKLFPYGTTVRLVSISPFDDLRDSVARVWFYSHVPGRVWLIFWNPPTNHHAPVPFLMLTDEYRLEAYADADAPQMPAWATPFVSN